MANNIIQELVNRSLRARQRAEEEGKQTPYTEGQYPVADAALKLFGRLTRPISSREEAEDPVTQLALGGDNPLNPMDRVEGPSMAITKAAQLLGKPKEQALRKLIDESKRLSTREDLINRIGKRDKVLQLQESVNPQTLVDYLRGFIRRNTLANIPKAASEKEANILALQNIKAQEKLQPIEDIISRRSPIKDYIRPNNEPLLDYSEINPTINAVEDIIGAKTPISTPERISGIKETPYTPKPPKIDHSVIDYKNMATMNQMETPTQTIKTILVEPKIKKELRVGDKVYGPDNDVGAFSFKVITDKETGKVLIQPQSSNAFIKQQGIGTEVYKQMEKTFGGKIVPDESRSVDALNLHLKRGYGREFGIPTSELQPSEYESKYENIRDALEAIKKKGKK